MTTDQPEPLSPTLIAPWDTEYVDIEPVAKPAIYGPYRRATTVEEEEYGGVYAGGPRPSEGNDRYDYPHDVDTGEYAIWLPHDCDEWVIACGTREEVLAKGREFLESVKAALDAMEAK